MTVPKRLKAGPRVGRPNPQACTPRAEAERESRSPYNFVPLPPVVVCVGDLPDHDSYAEGRYSGYWDVTLTTRSPLYVRCPMTLAQYAQQQTESAAKRERGEDRESSDFRRLLKNLPDFFYTRQPGEPVIPGSSLRGMLRTLVEVAGYGKVRWINNKQLFFRTVDDSAVGKAYNQRMVSGTGRPGDGYRSRAEGGFWREIAPGPHYAIQPCTVIRVELDEVVQALGAGGVGDLYQGRGPMATPKVHYQGRTVWVQVNAEQDHPHSNGRFMRYRKSPDVKTHAQPGYQQGVLVLTGPMQNKHMAFVFVPNSSAPCIDVPPEMVERFHDEDQLTQWQERAFADGARKQKGYLCHNEPVFFLREKGTLRFFGRAQMFRLPYDQSPLDLVPIELRRPEDVDLAEALFGYVRTDDELKDMAKRGLPVPRQGEKGRAYGGRVFVTEAVLRPDQTDVFEEVTVPRILATPKPTAFQHYLVQTSDDKTTLKHYDSQSPQGADTVIRGHKFYWHQGQRVMRDVREADEQWLDPAGVVKAASTQHTQMRPVKAGKQFGFRVYFENLSPAELGVLQWIFDVGGGEHFALSLGMGKPLGLGAVQTQARLHVIERKARYQQLCDDGGWVSGERADAEAIARQAVAEFEQQVLAALGEAQRASHLEDLDRVRALLALLSWPGPAPDRVSYPEIGRRMPTPRPNEFRYRPVLPPPGALVKTVRPTPARQVGIVPRADRAPREIPPGYTRGRVLKFGLGANQSYGYIRPEGGGQDLFVHRSKLAAGLTALSPGQRVVFKVVRAADGKLSAEDVRLE